MGQTIACANQKGGVGKTTTVVNLSTSLARAGDRVLVVDLDPQGNATSGFGIDRAGLDQSLYDGLIDGSDASALVVSTKVEGLDLLPSTTDLAGAEVELARLEQQRDRRLARLLAPLADRYEEVFLDCPPSLGLLTVNALTAADSVLIPVQCEYYALEGLTHLVETIRLVQDHLNPRLTIKGALLTMFDSRTNLSAEVAADVRRHLGPVVYETIVPRSVRLSEAPSYGLPVALYSPDSRGAEAYDALAREFLAREGRWHATEDRTLTGAPA